MVATYEIAQMANVSRVTAGLQVDYLPVPFRELRQAFCQPGFRAEYRCAPDVFRIVYVEEGTLRCRAGKQERILRDGEYAISAPDTILAWENRSDDAVRVTAVHLLYGAAGFAAPLQAVETMCAGSVFFGKDNGSFAAGIQEIEQEKARDRVGWKLYAGTVLTRLLLDIIRCGAEEDDTRKQIRAASRIDRALWYIERNLGERITLDGIAGQLGVSTNHACDLFRRAVGTSPMAHLKRVRLERAQMLLAGTALRTGAIGRMVGVEDEHYFSKMFRKNTGMSPTVYRAAVRCASAN